MNIKRFIEPYKDLPISIYVLFLASLINNMGNFVYPLLTMYLTYKIGLEAGLVGTFVAISSVLGLIGSLIGGKLIDKVGRKSIFIIFRSISALCILSCGFIENFYIFIMFIMISSLVTGITSPFYSTIITDLTSGEKRKTAFFLEYMAMNIGMAVGPLLAAFLFNNFLKFLFIGDSITTFISIVLVWRFVPETFAKNDKSIDSKVNTKLEQGEEGGLLTALIKRPTMIIFSMIMVIYFLVFSQYNFGLSLQLGDIFGENAAIKFGWLMTVNTVLCSIMPMFLAPLFKKIKPSLCISLGGILYFIGFGMIYKINSFPLFIISTVLWTFGEILVATNTSVYIASQAPSTHRGRFNSIFPIIRKLGFIFGPFIAGIYVENLGIRNLWLLIGGLAFVGGILMYSLYYCENKKNSLELDLKIEE